MKKLLIMLLLAGIGYKGYETFVQHEGGAFDADGNAVALLFVHDGCGKPCDDAVRLLDRRHVEYEKLNVSDSDEQVARWEQFGSERRMPLFVAGSARVVGYHKWEMVSALGEAFGGSYLTRSENRYFAKNFSLSGEPKLVMYTMNGCGYCDQARDYLTREGISFEERNTSEDYVAKTELDRFQAGTPLIFYGYKRLVGWGEGVRSDLESLL